MYMNTYVVSSDNTMVLFIVLFQILLLCFIPYNPHFNCHTHVSFFGSSKPLGCSIYCVSSSSSSSYRDAEVQFSAVLCLFLQTSNWTYGPVQAVGRTLNQTSVQVQLSPNLVQTYFPSYNFFWPAKHLSISHPYSCKIGCII